MKLALRGNRRRTIRINTEGIKKAFNMGKSLYAKIKSRMSRNKRQPMTGVVTNYGRTIKKIPLNLSKNLKRGLRHCGSLLRQKISVFKSSIEQQANQIYYYAGEYKGNELNKYDNEAYTQNGGTAKSQTSNYIYGGGLGFGRYDQSFASNAGIANNCCFTNGNVFACCLDIPTGYTLPAAFYGDFKHSGLLVQRMFGMYQQPIYGNAELVALNNNEKTTTYSSAPLFPASDKFKAVYTLAYEYTFKFSNKTVLDYDVFVVTCRLNHFKLDDTTIWQGFSNWINYSQGITTEDDVYKYLEGHLPSTLFKTIRVIKKRLRGVTNYQTSYKGQQYAEIKIRSGKDYIAVARKPTNVTEGTSANASNTWYNESHMKYTYCFAWAKPVDVMTADADNAAYTPIPGNVISYRVIKKTKYCIIE